MILVLHPERIEEDLAAGEVSCPRCAVPLRAWSWARPRRIRQLDGSSMAVRPRRARCGSCRATHVLVPADCLPHRADSAQVIGMALLARAAGHGYRRIAADLRRPVSTVRGWLRPLHDRHLRWLYGRGVQHTYRHAPQFLDDQKPHANALGDALEALGRAVVAFRRRFADTAATWSLVTMFTSGRLLGPTPPT